MARDYIIRRMADIDENVNGEDYLGRTVYEEHELIDIGIVDQNGDKIMARKRMDQIGFVRFPERV
jgi:hypothetical protein